VGYWGLARLNGSFEGKVLLMDFDLFVAGKPNTIIEFGPCSMTSINFSTSSYDERSLEEAQKRPMTSSVNCCACSCVDPDCEIGIRFDAASSALWFTDKAGNETLMYLDANSIIRLIVELRDVLLYLSGATDA
jgi:hypothetical protein